MDLNTQIDRSSYAPYYVQVIDALKDFLERGGARPGDQLPGEPELCRLFDVSRTVIRQALKELEHEGLIVREKGRGTFVAEPKIGERLFQELTGFYQDMAAKGHPPTSQVLRQESVPASGRVAAWLHLAAGTSVIRIDRLRFVQGEPILLVNAYLPLALCPKLLDADLSHQSLYVFLEQAYGFTIARGHRILEAVPANEYEASLLNVKRGAPLVLLDSISYLEDGTPLEYYHALHRGDRARFEVELVRVRDGGTSRQILAEEAIRLSADGDHMGL